MKYLLDTDICIYLLRSREVHLEPLERLTPGDVGMSAVTAGELIFGAYKSQRVEENLIAARALQEAIPVVALTPQTAEVYGLMRAVLERNGTPIGANDLWIAAHALSLGLTLVTRNAREFSQVEGLRVEHWL